MKIVENAVPKNLFNYIVQKVKNSPFQYIENTTSSLYESAPHDSSFVQLIFNSTKGVISQNFYTIEAALMVAFESCNEEVNELIRIRVGLITTQPLFTIHTPHVDFDVPHKTCLFYLNDSDGDTFIYENKFEHGHNLKSHQYYNLNIKQKKMKVLHQSTPVANKMVMFDGLHYHSSSTPTNTSARLVMNINYR